MATVDLRAAAGAATLGAEALAAIVDRSLDGVVVADVGGRIQFVNAAGCTIAGRSYDDLIGRPVLDIIAPRDHAAVSSHALACIAGAPGTWHATIIRPDGEERDVQYSNLAYEVDGQRFTAALLRDVSATSSAARTAAALGQVAASLSGSRPLPEILDTLAHATVDGTRAIAAAVVLFDCNGLAGTIGLSGLSERYRHAIQSASPAIARLPGLDMPSSPRIFVEPDGPAVLAATPDLQRLVPALEELRGWRLVTHAPLTYRGKVTGVLVAYFAAEVATPTDAEVAFLTTLADAAALASANAGLLSRAQDSAAAEERTRLARELHDSVSQDLFTILTHGRAAGSALRRGSEGALDIGMRGLDVVVERAQVAIADMRALLMELRPEGIAAEGLVGALGRLAAAVSGREGLQVDAHGPSALPDLPPEIIVSLYRLVQEAVHNAVKHAQPSRIWISVTSVDDCVTVEVGDDGRGFDIAAVPAGHFGLRTMRERAERLRASLTVDSHPGGGTVIRVVLALRPEVPGPRVAPESD